MFTWWKIVSKVYWSLGTKRGEYECNCFTKIQLDYEENFELIDYLELTEEIVLNWVKDKLQGTENNNEVHLKSVLSKRPNELELEPLKPRTSLIIRITKLKK